MSRALVFALALAAGCQQSAPQGAPAPAPAEPAHAQPAPGPTLTRPPPEPLTQEELDLIAADPAALTPELRRKRAFALRKKILQDPDSPSARQLEALRGQVERGEIVPQLPARAAPLPAGHPASSIPEPEPHAPAP